MAHLNVKNEYIGLVKRLNENVAGLPEPADSIAKKGWKDILELVYTPEEALIASSLPVVPSSIHTIAHICNINENDLLKSLHRMCDKGIVMDIINPDTGDVLYILSPPVIGFFEFTMMKNGIEIISKTDLAEAISVYCTNSDDFVRELHGSGQTALGRTLVYESLINDGLIPDVYHWEKVNEIIEKAGKIAIAKCYCRHKTEHLGQVCDSPQDTCFYLDQYGDFVIRRDFGKEISVNAALDILADCRKHGLVHMVDNVKNKPAWICNCCKCCCGFLKSINYYGFRAVNPSGFIPYQKINNCINCGRCVKACPVNAISIVEQKSHAAFNVKVNYDQCIGCGICVNKCARSILDLKKRIKESFIPDSSLELIIYRAFERGKLAEMVFEYGERFGIHFLYFTIKIVSSLPYSKKNSAVKQLNSRFFHYITKA